MLPLERIEKINTLAFDYYSENDFTERFDNMNSMEIQREAIIEIVGTQYEGRAVNHQPVFLQQDLILKHQSDNPHDHNAVMLLTDDGKELGFLPKGYASLYAPAIDSGRYNFAVEIVKAEPDQERPILIVKITSELINHSEEEIEMDILNFVRNIVNGYSQSRTEYLKFIYSDAVNVDELLSALNRTRLIQKLYSCSSDIIKNCNIVQNSDKYTPLPQELLLKYLRALEADVRDILKKIQKAYNESFDIDDETEYNRVQREIREKRKRFRSYDELLTSFIDAAESYVNVGIKSQFSVTEVKETQPLMTTYDSSSSVEPKVSESVVSITAQSTPETNIPNSKQLTEQAFFDWLVSEGDVSDLTAKQYISNIHSIEKLYQTLFCVRRNILGTASLGNVKEMIETLVQRSEYIDANERRHNSFSASLSKFAQFAGIAVDGIKTSAEKKNYKPPMSTGPFAIKTVDFNNPQNCTYNKPCSFILNGSKYFVGNWRELYTKLLTLLYNDSHYSELLKNLSGRSLYGRRIDFADKTFLHCLRAPITVSSDFFAEGNLSAIDIIKHIKCLMELCSIDDEHMIIEYAAQEKEDEVALPDDETNDYKQPVIDPATEQTNITENNTPVPTSFTPDTTKPFILKNVLMEILSSDAYEITKYRRHREGISPKSLFELIKEYYGKTIGIFEISKLLMLDKAFQSVGKGCFILNKAMISHTEAEHQRVESASYEKEESNENVADIVQSDNAPALPDNRAVENVNTRAEKNLTIALILEVIKEKSDDLQYEDGFGAYEVKTLLSHKGYTDVSEEQIEELMSICSDLKQVEEGYYSLVNKEIADKTLSEPPVIVEEKITDESVASITLLDESTQGSQAVSDNANHIVFKINGNNVRAYDYSDALNKVCEFSINCKPFKMARIAEQTIQINGNRVFYRQAVPVDGYNKLSNGLQIISIDTLSDLQTIINAVKNYCQIDDKMIDIISQ